MRLLRPTEFLEMAERAHRARLDLESGEASELSVQSNDDMIALIKYAVSMEDVVAATVNLHDNWDVKIGEDGKPEPWAADVKRVEETIAEFKAACNDR